MFIFFFHRNTVAGNTVITLTGLSFSIAFTQHNVIQQSVLAAAAKQVKQMKETSPVLKSPTVISRMFLDRIVVS